MGHILAMLRVYALLYALLRAPPYPAPPGHYHLWVNGIPHGDVTPDKLMHTVLPSGELKGILRDYDFAPRDKHPTTNYGRMRTILFIALEMVEYRLQNRIPQLYRHDSGSFIWVLAHITLANKNHTVKTSRSSALGPWLDGLGAVHLLSKKNPSSSSTAPDYQSLSLTNNIPRSSEVW